MKEIANTVKEILIAGDNDHPQYLVWDGIAYQEGKEPANILGMAEQDFQNTLEKHLRIIAGGK